MEAKGGFARRPKSLVCHICGREFGTASLKIHIPRCAKLWEDREAQKPSNERRPVPQAPEIISQGAASTWQEIEQQNAAAAAAFEEQAMQECPNCHRTFLEDRLTVHLRSCRPDRVLNPLNKGKASNEETKKQLSSTVGVRNSPTQNRDFANTANPTTLSTASRGSRGKRGKAGPARGRGK